MERGAERKWRLPARVSTDRNERERSMVICPQCKHSFSEIDQPCKRCKGGRFQYKFKNGDVVYEQPVADSRGPFKQSPCKRCNGNGVERSAANRNNRSRGSSNEYKACHTFQDWWLAPDGTKYEFKRTPQSGGSDLAEGFDMAGDICTNAPDWKFHVECKRDKGWSFQQLMTTPDGCARLGTFISQAMHDCMPGKIPMLWLMSPGPSQPTFIMILRTVTSLTAHGFVYGDAFVDGRNVPYTIMSIQTFLKQTPAYWRNTL